MKSIRKLDYLGAAQTEATVERKCSGDELKVSYEKLSFVSVWISATQLKARARGRWLRNVLTVEEIACA